METIKIYGCRYVCEYSDGMLLSSSELKKNELNFCQNMTKMKSTLIQVNMNTAGNFTKKNYK